MVTKRTGNPPGRPRKSVKADEGRGEGGGRGRPRLLFRTDPDRYCVALMHTFNTHFGSSDRAAAKAIAMFMDGNELHSPEQFPPDLQELARKHFSTQRDGMVPVAFGPSHPDRYTATFKNTRDGVRASTIEGRASTLTRKYREFQGNPSAKEWCHYMSLCIGLIFIGISDRELMQKLARQYALNIGELEFVEDAIIPRII